LFYADVSGQVCGLKWSYDGTQLASGGNDNKLFIWDASSTTPLLKFQTHVAAVKAIAWSPHQVCISLDLLLLRFVINLIPFREDYLLLVEEQLTNT
jgi:WD40 repeat protein